MSNDDRKRPDTSATSSKRVFDSIVGRLAQPVVDQIDIESVVDRIDVNAMLDRVDINEVLDRIDVDRLLDRIDVDRLLDRVDVDRLVARADVAQLAQRAQIGDLVAESTGKVANNALGLARRQLAGLDLVFHGTMRRIVRRSAAPVEAGPPLLVSSAKTGERRNRTRISGHYAGGISRLAANALDVAIITAMFSLLAGVAEYLVHLVSDYDVVGSRNGVGWGIAFATFAFLYQWVSLAATGRTIGKAIVGLQVVSQSGEPLHVSRALIRVLAYPLSFTLFGLGLVGVVFGERRLALHDHMAGSCVVYNWGDRPAELPSPLSRWLAARTAA